MLKSCWANVIVVCLLCVGTWNSSAGSSVRFTVERIGKERGLPQSVVLALCQTKDGYLWIGTPQGLARFDGNHATFFDENNTPELTSSQITRIFEDAQGNLWLGTATAGALLLDKEGRLRRVDSGATSAADRMMATCQDSSGVVWLYRANAQLQRYFDGK